MRSQAEILEKIEETSLMFRDKKDPIFQSYKVLVHKLTWKNAKSFIVEKDYNEDYKKKWENTSHLEKSYLISEIKEQMDLSAMCVQSGDKIGCLGCFIILHTLIWLCGPKYDKFLITLWQEFMRLTHVVRVEEVFLMICNEFQIDWEKLKLRYPKEEKSRLILPGGNNGNSIITN